MSGHLTAWDIMATWLDQKHQDEGDLWHRTLIDPSVFRLLGPVTGQRVLELACGNGYLAHKLARLGAEVTAVDASPALIALAKQRLRQAGLAAELKAGSGYALEIATNQWT